MSIAAIYPEKRVKRPSATNVEIFLLIGSVFLSEKTGCKIAVVPSVAPKFPVSGNE